MCQRVIVQQYALTHIYIHAYEYSQFTSWFGSFFFLYFFFCLFSPLNRNYQHKPRTQAAFHHFSELKFKLTSTWTVCSSSTHYRNSRWFHLLQIMYFIGVMLCHFPTFPPTHCCVSPVALQALHTVSRKFIWFYNIFHIMIFVYSPLSLLYSTHFVPFRLNSILFNFQLSFALKK